MLWHTTSSIKQLVGAITLSQPRTLNIGVLVTLSLLTLVHHRTTKGFLCHVESAQFATIGNHVAIQLQIVALWITPHEPSLAIVINQYRWVNMVPTAIFEQRLSNSITEWACWRVAHSNTNSHTIGYLRMCTDIPKEFAIALYTL